MRQVPLTQGYVALVDDVDYLRVMMFKWQANVRRRKDGSILRVYAYRKARTEGRPIQKLHRFILGITDPAIKVDHEDGDGLNCQSSNLRRATVTENGRNQRLCNVAGYKGVAWNITSKKWQAKLTLNGKTIHLGMFPTIEKAACAYDVAAMKLFGEFARTNVILGLLPKETQ